MPDSRQNLARLADGALSLVSRAVRVLHDDSANEDLVKWQVKIHMKVASDRACKFCWVGKIFQVPSDEFFFMKRIILMLILKPTNSYLETAIFELFQKVYFKN